MKIKTNSERYDQIIGEASELVVEYDLSFEEALEIIKIDALGRIAEGM